MKKMSMTMKISPYRNNGKNALKSLVTKLVRYGMNDNTNIEPAPNHITLWSILSIYPKNF